MSNESVKAAAGPAAHAYISELEQRIAELEAALDEVCEFVDFDAADDARCASAEPLETIVNRALEGE